MATFAFSEDDRQRWADEGATAVAVLALALRKRMASNLSGAIPAEASAVFQSSWWQAGIDGPVTDEYERIAGEAAVKFHEGAGFGVMPDKLRDLVASATAAAIVGVMGGRGPIVEDRVAQLIDQAAGTERTGEQLATELGLDGTGGPLSDELMSDIGRANSNALVHGAAEQTMTELDMDARRTWRAIFVNTRPDHADADGQVAEAGEPFEIGGEEAFFPGDPQLSDEQSCNCQCYLDYEVAGAAADESADGNPDVVDSVTMPSDQIAASVRRFPLRRPAALVNRTWDGARFYGTKAMARRTRTFAPEIPSVPAVDETPQPDNSAGIAVTIVPTVAEKQILAVPGGLAVAEIHCTLAYLGTTADLDDTARATVSTVLANIAAEGTPITGEVAGVGWFGSAEALTVYLVDGDGLAAFRTKLVDALAAAGVSVVSDHDFIPHITAAYSHVDEAADRAGMPLHFDEVRCMWGEDVYVWDLTAPLDVAPEPVIVEPEIAPTGAPVMAANEPVDSAAAHAILATKITHPDGLNLQARPDHHFIVREGVAVEVADNATLDTAADDMVPVEPDPELAPADPGTLADDTLVAELARRAADTAIQEQTDAGAVLTPDDIAAVHAAAEEEADQMFAELVDELAGDAAGQSDDGDWETTPDGEGDDAIVLGPAEGYAAHAVTGLLPDGTQATFPTGTVFLNGGVTTTPVKVGAGNSSALSTGRGGGGSIGTWSVTLSPDAAARFQPGHKGQAFAIEGIPAAPAVTEYDWQGPITVEGVPSGDMRMFAEGSLDWRQLPVPLAWLDKITREHQEGEFAGWIHAVERRADGGIWGFGTYAPVPAAERMKAVLNDPKGPGRFGISVDVDSVTAVYSTPDGQILDPMEAQEAYYAGEPVMEMMTSGRIAGACYDEETEILTEERGWQKFADVYPEDRVATRSPKTGAFEWQDPFYYHHETADEVDRMIHFTGKGNGRGKTLDLLVTPNHRMLVESTKTGKPMIMRADELIEKSNRSYRFITTSGWDAPDVSTFRIPGIERPPEGYCQCGCGERVYPQAEKNERCSVDDCDNPATGRGYCNPHYQRWKRSGGENGGDPLFGGPLKKNVRPNQRLVKMPDVITNHKAPKFDGLTLMGDDYAAFMGMYLSEGYHSNNNRTVFIAQIPEGKGFERFESLITRMFGKCRHDGVKAFAIANVALTRYVDRFGTARQKFVPNELKNFSARQLRIFLEYYIAGDGDADGRRISTGSKRMAGDLQEIAQKCGMWSYVAERERRGPGNEIDGREICANGPQYMVSLRNRPDAGRSNAHVWGWKAEWVDDYDGDVRCVSVPNEVLYVRRNGIPAWCGNTCVLHAAFMEAQVWDCGPVVDEAIAASGAVVTVDRWRSIGPGLLRPTALEAVAASAGVTDITAPPPSNWFELDLAEEASAPTRNDLGAFRVFPPDDKGRIRIYGVLAPPKECHLGITGRCQVLPTSTDFSRFYATGEASDPWAKFYTGQPLSRFYADAKSVICDDGKEIVVGPLILDNVHPNLARQASDSQPFYAHTGSAVGDLRLHMTSRGLVAAGAIRPGVSWVDVYKVRASSTSPDWRPIGNEVKVIAVLAVNVSGFQLQPLAASGALQYEDLEASIMETASNVQAIAASAGQRGVTTSDDRIAVLESTIERMAPVVQVMEQMIAANRDADVKAATRAALESLGVVDRRSQTSAALQAMGITIPDVPCACGN